MHVVQKLHSLIAVQPNAPDANLNGRLLWGQCVEGAAINTAINRRHKSLALLPAGIDIVVACAIGSSLNLERATTRNIDKDAAISRKKHRKRNKDTGWVKRSVPPPLHVERRDAWARFHKRRLRGWVFDNALVTSNADTSCRVYLLASRSRPDQAP